LHTECALLPHTVEQAAHLLAQREPRAHVPKRHFAAQLIARLRRRSTCASGSQR
jgi:hypothetical protein